MDENSKNLNEENIYECKLRGTLKVKNDKMNCIIGDCVEFDKKEKVIEKIEKRKNFLYRPLIANIDFIGILFAIKSPNFDFINFQKMLLNANSQNIPVILILSKIDLVSEEELEEFLNKFKKGGFNDFLFRNLEVYLEKFLEIQFLFFQFLHKQISVSQN